MITRAIMGEMKPDLEYDVVIVRGTETTYAKDRPGKTPINMRVTLLLLTLLVCLSGCVQRVRLTASRLTSSRRTRHSDA